MEKMDIGDLICYITGGVHNVPPVNSEPNIILSCFSVVSCDRDKNGKIINDRHLIGYDINNGEGRVSSAIMTVEKPSDGKFIFTTKSGRRYKTINPIKLEQNHSDALYVFNTWKKVHKAENVKDLTEEF